MLLSQDLLNDSVDRLLPPSQTYTELHLQLLPHPLLRQMIEIGSLTYPPDGDHQLSIGDPHLL